MELGEQKIIFLVKKLHLWRKSMEQQRKCRNRYVDIGPLREYDVNVIRNALAMYADCAESTIENSVRVERMNIAPERLAALDMVRTLSKPLPDYE